MTTRTWFRVLLVLSLVTFALSAIALTSAQDEENVLVIAIASDVETVDPPFSTFQRSNETNYNVYDQFFQYAIVDSGEDYAIADTGTIEGSAIESWEWVDDQTLVMQVREGMTFAKSGNPVTADDFIFWYERALGTEAGTLWNVNTGSIESFEKTGDYEVTVHFTQPSPWFFYLFRDQSQAAQDSLVAQEHATADDAWAAQWLAKNDIGSGEFYIESWEPGVEIVLRANPDYWAGPAFFDRVILRIIPDSANRALLLREGEVDIATDLSTEELQALRGSDGVKVLSIPTRNQMILGFNVQQEPFDDPLVRQALSYAVPYEDIIAGVFSGNGLVSAGPIPVGGQFHDSSLWPYSLDLDQARALLEEAGLGDGFEFTLDIASGSPVTEQIAILLQDSLAQIGVTMNINPQSSSEFAEQLGTLEHQAWMRDLLWYVDDPGYTGKLFFQTGAVANWMGYSNAELDTVIDELSVTVDATRQAELAQQYQTLLIEDAPALYLAEMPFEIAMREDIQGYVQLPDNLLWYYPLSRAE